MHTCTHAHKHTHTLTHTHAHTHARTRTHTRTHTHTRSPCERAQLTLEPVAALVEQVLNFEIGLRPIDDALIVPVIAKDVVIQAARTMRRRDSGSEMVPGGWAVGSGALLDAGNNLSVNGDVCTAQEHAAAHGLRGGRVPRHSACVAVGEIHSSTHCSPPAHFLLAFVHLPCSPCLFVKRTCS